MSDVIIQGVTPDVEMEDLVLSIKSTISSIDDSLIFLRDTSKKFMDEYESVRKRSNSRSGRGVGRPRKGTETPSSLTGGQEKAGTFNEKLQSIANYLAPKKVSPKRSVMLKHSPESVYLADTILGQKEDTERSEKKGLLSGLLGGGIGGGLLGTLGMGKMLKGLGPLAGKLAKMGPVAAIIGGLVWMAIDGIKGFFKADEWGVSGIAGALGGLLGGTEGGVKGVFKNMGKWALLGAGIGSVVPVVGTIVGGLIGAAIGGILGLIGGKNIAKGMDKIGKWFQKVWKSDFVQGVKDFLIELPNKLINVVKGLMGSLDREIRSFQENPGAWAKEKWGAITGKIGEFFTVLKVRIGEGWEAAKGWVTDRIINPIYFFFGSIKTAIGDAASKTARWVQEKLIWPIRDFFGTLGSFFGAFKDMDVKDIWNAVRGKGDGLFQSSMQATEDEKLKKVARNKFGSQGMKYMSLDAMRAKLYEQGEYFPGISKYEGTQSGNDMVIKPSGKMFRTAPGDTIVATRSPVSAIKDSEMNDTVKQGEKASFIHDSTVDMVNVLKEISSKLENQLGDANIVNQNFSSPYNPDNIMKRLIMEIN